MDAPIFVVGANRSGTTLLRLMLNAHSRIAIPDELTYITPYLGGAGIQNWKDPGFSPSRYRSFVRRFLASKAETLAPLDVDPLTEHIVASSAPNLRSPYQLALEAWAHHHNKSRWGEKTPSNVFYADIILDMFPDAHFIHMIRDPRAGTASMQRASIMPDDLVFNALARHKFDIEGRKYLETSVPPPQRMTLRYEDLVRTPEQTMRTVCDFLNEPFEPDMLQYHQDAAHYMKDEARTSYNEAATRPIDPSKIDAWRDTLSPHEKAIVDHVCRTTIQQFNYPLTDTHLSLSSRIEITIKQMYWHHKCRVNGHIRHYTVKYPMLTSTKKRIRSALHHALRILPFNILSPYASNQSSSEK